MKLKIKNKRSVKNVSIRFTSKDIIKNKLIKPFYAGKAKDYYYKWYPCGCDPMQYA